MLFWYRIEWTDNHGVHHDIVCCRDHWDTREEFLTELTRWTSPQYRYREVPETCINKLFPNVKWVPDMDMNWPRQ